MTAPRARSQMASTMRTMYPARRRTERKGLVSLTAVSL
jgi:hypothetical protein